MGYLLSSIAVFLAAHVLPSTPLRGWLIARIGRRGFMRAFSALSLALFVWVWIAYRQAEVETLFWVTGPAVRMASALVMLAATMLLVFAATAERRVFLTGETVLGDPEAIRGILRVTRHPLLWAVGLWGLVHMLNNADPPSWLFFGFMTLLALAGTWAIDRRRARLLGPDWDALAGATSNVPFLAIAQGRNRLLLSEFGVLPLALACFLWGLLVIFHETVFGLPALLL